MQYLNPSGKLNTCLSRPKNMIGRGIRIITLSLLGMLATHQLLAQKHYAKGENNTINGICVGCAVLNSGMAVTNTDLTDFSTIMVVPGIKDGYAKQILIFPQVSQGGKDSIVIRIGTVSRYTDAAAFQKVEVTTYNGVTSNNDRLSLTSSGVNLVPTNDPWTWEIRIMPVHAFDRVELQVNSDLVSFVSAVQVYYAYYKQYVLPDANGVVYVKKGSTGNGSSWANAIGELSDALLYGEFNPAVKQIWVAGGSYKPLYSAMDDNRDRNMMRNNSFVLPDNVKLYGSFAGTESQLEERNLGIIANRTILNGDIGDDDDLSSDINGSNIFHLVIASGGGTHMDGFTLRGGAASYYGGSVNTKGRAVPSHMGSAIFNHSSALELNNVFIQGNLSGIGAIYNESGALTIQNAVVSGNKGYMGTGGLVNSNGNCLLVNTVFSGIQNSGAFGTIQNTNSDLLIYNSILYGNAPANVFTWDNNKSLSVNYSFVEDGTFVGTNNFTHVDPLFVDMPAPAASFVGGNYMLKANSPAINAGTNSQVKYATDITGSVRIVDAAVDMGAYERQLQPQTITVTNLTRTYGDAAFEPGFTASSALEVSYVSANNNIAEAYRDAAEGNKWKIKIKKAGTVTLTASQAGGGGYSAATVDFTLTINRKPVTVSIDPAFSFSKIYDGTTIAAIDASTLTFSPGDIISGDQVGFDISSTSASYDNMSAGNNKTVSLPASGITLNGASADNYVLSNAAAMLSSNNGTINPRLLTIMADAKSKIYGSNDPVFTYSPVGLLAGDPISGALSRNTGEDAGTYTLTQGTVNAGTNYSILFVSALLHITQKPVTVSLIPGAVFKKIYDGNADAVVTSNDLSLAAGDIVNNDQVILSIPNNAASFDNKNAGTQKVVTVLASQISLTGTKAANYSIFNQAGTLTSTTGVILPRAITITVTPATKVFGTTDPVLNYNATGLITGEQLTGALARTPGENAGNYSITQGTLSAGSNYTVTFNGNLFTITKATQTINWSQVLITGCNGIQPIQLTASTTSGMPVSYIVANTGVATVNGTLLMPVKPGQTTITAVQAGDNNYEPAANAVQTFSYQSPDAIRQRWNDVLVFDNSSNDYVQWQWFKNGTSINGATQQYYNEPAGLKGDYYVIATTKNGEQLQSCPVTATGAASGGQLKVAPNPAKPGSTISVNCNYDASLLTGAKLQLTSVTGTVMQQVTNVLPLTKFDMPATGGLYIITLVLNNGQKASLNILVK